MDSPHTILQHELWSAVGSANTAQVRAAVAAGADVNLPIAGPGGETPLIRAVAADDLEMVRLLLELGADVNHRCDSPKAWTPLMFAHDRPGIIPELVAAGAELEVRTQPDWIRRPSGPFEQRGGGQTALHLAAIAGNADAVRALLQAGADPEATDAHGLGPLDCAIQQGAVTEAAEALVQGGAKLTPRRLEQMHTSAHRPDSDLLTFPVDPEPARPGAPIPSTAAGQGQGPEAAGTVRCPFCQSLIYSRKARLCGQCGRALPPELVLTDHQAQAIADHRQWARDLANKFAPACSPGSAGGRSPSGPNPLPSTAVETLLQRVSCAEEFRHRPRPDFWIYCLGYTLLFAVGTFLTLKFGFLPPGSVVVMIVLFIIACVARWHLASPSCPNCHQNIRFCGAEFCHVCGDALRHRRCTTCGVDYSWLGVIQPRRSAGTYSWIVYCPGCGARLDSWVTRWRPRS